MPEALVNLVLCLVGLVPAPADRHLFPDEDECRSQLSDYRRNLTRLENLRLAQGDPDGRISEWVRQTRHAIIYWELLLQAQERPWLTGEGWTVDRLAALRQHVGWQRYHECWHPPLFGEGRPGLTGWRPRVASTEAGRERNWWEP